MSFKIGTCKISVSFFFFSVLCICALSDKSGVMFYGILSALFHEIGHLVTAFFFGYTPKALTANSSGLKMHIPSLAENSKAYIFTAFSGPFANLLLFTACYHLSRSFSAANLVLCTLNLLPCDPFDGGIILRTLLEKKLSEKTADKIMFSSTLITLTLLLTFGAFVLMKSRFNFSLLALSMLVFTTICQRTLQ